MAVLIQSIESIEIHRHKRNKQKTTKKTTHTHTQIKPDRLVNGARWAFQCFVYNTNKIIDPF